MALKPVPKAILIAAVVGAAAFAGMKLLPKQAPTPVAPEVAAPAPTTVAPPTHEQVEAAKQPEVTAPAPAPAPADPTPRSNVSTGDAGLSAVLGAGR
jgi:hypothetical protein